MAEESLAVAYDLKKSLSVKALVVLLLGFVACGIVLLVKHYFYILDAYVYTGEFHMLFISNNMKAANAAFFSEYLKPMSFFMALPICLAATCYAGLDPDSSVQVLLQASTAAFGAPVSFLFIFLGFLSLALLSFGVGTLVAGDIVPLITGHRYGRYLHTLQRPALLLFSLGFAVPVFPVMVTAVVGAFAKVPFSRMLQCLAAGLFVRTLIEMLMI